MTRALIGILAAGLVLPPSSAFAQAKQEKAQFAGGCFWCMTPPFEKLEGVSKVLSGYADGGGENPTYQDYAERGFVEVVEVTYDPAKVSYPSLLDVFWRQVNPTDSGGQFCDRGPQYRPVVYYAGEAQKAEAEKSKAALAKTGRFDKPISTEIRPAAKFWAAEEYHQDYWKKNPIRYHYYRHACGRDQYLEKVWAKDSKKSPR